MRSGPAGTWDPSLLVRSPGLRLQSLADLAHELRTPLQTLIGYLEIIRDEYQEQVGAEPKRLLDRMNVATHDLARTVENILEFVSVESWSDTSQEEDVAISDLVTEVRPLLDAANQGRGLTLTFDTTAAPKAVRCWRRPLRSIIANLALAAIKHTASGSVNVAIRRGSVPQSESVVEIEVSNSGPGVVPELIKLACIPFSNRLRDDPKRFHGLSLAFTVILLSVEALGGTFNLASDPDLRASFVARIPFKAPQTQLDRTESRPELRASKLLPIHPALRNPGALAS